MTRADPANLPASAEEGAALAACTIVSRNYLAQARVLIDSFLRQEPRGRFYALVVDELPPEAELHSDVRVVRPAELGIAYLRELCFKYEVTEFCTALKPSLLSFLLKSLGESIVVYLDPDVWLANPLDEVVRAVEASDIVLTPHVLSPLPQDDRDPTEAEMQSVGVFNLGFLALRNSAETLRFLDWWTDRLRDGCRRDPARGFFVDQKWIDQVPDLFPTYGVLRDPTYNVAYWNLYERSIGRAGDRFLVNGEPLTFFHFSNVDIGGRAFRRSHWNRETLVAGSALADLINLYGGLVESAGYASTKRWEYGFARFDNGLSITLPMRELYRTLETSRREEFGDPFETDSPDSFFRWAVCPDPETGLSPFLQKLYELREDLWQAFPDPRGRDRAAFLEWAASSGAKEMGYEPEFATVGSRAALEPVAERERRANFALFEILEVSRDRSDLSDLQGFSIDFPRPGDACDPRALDFEGWVLGRSEPVVAVEGIGLGKLLGRARVGRRRLDVATTFPGAAGADSCGFAMSLGVTGLRSGEIRLDAVLRGGGRVPLAGVRGTLGWSFCAERDEAPLVSVVIARLPGAPDTDDALSRVLGQEYPHLETVVVGEAPGMPDAAPAGQFGVKFLKCRGVSLAEAFNRGLRQTSAEFLLFLAPSERLLPNAVAAGLREFRAHSESAVILGHAPVPPPFCSQAGEEDGQIVSAAGSRFAGALYRRAAIEFVGNFNLTPETAPIDDLCRRVASAFPVRCHHEIVAE